MKRGMILHITKGNEEITLKGPGELVELSRSLGVDTVCVVTAEDEMADGWWHLLSRGVNQVLFMTVSFDPALGKFSRGTPLLLCGSRCGIDLQAGHEVGEDQDDGTGSTRGHTLGVRH